MLLARLLEQPDHFRGLSRVDGFDLVLGFYSATTDDQVVFAAELAAHLLHRCSHLASVLFAREVGQWLVDEWPFMNPCPRRGLHCSHDYASLKCPGRTRETVGNHQFYTPGARTRRTRVVAGYASVIRRSAPPNPAPSV